MMTGRLAVSLTALFLFFSMGISVYAQKENNAVQVTDDEKEIARLKKAIEENPSNAENYFEMGWYMQKKSFYSRAEQNYKKCVELNKRHTSAWVNLGNLAKMRRDYNEAERYYKIAIELSPRFAKARYNLGTLYLSMKEYDKALHELHTALMLEPNNKSAYLNLGTVYLSKYRLYYQKRYLKLAQEYLLEAGKIDRKYAHMYYNMAMAYELDNQPGVALQYYREAVRYYPDHNRYKKKSLKKIQYLEHILNSR